MVLCTGDWTYRGHFRQGQSQCHCTRNGQYHTPHQRCWTAIYQTGREGTVVPKSATVHIPYFLGMVSPNLAIDSQEASSVIERARMDREPKFLWNTNCQQRHNRSGRKRNGSRAIHSFLLVCPSYSPSLHHARHLTSRDCASASRSRVLTDCRGCSSRWRLPWYAF
jgi:hypothetical protein